MAFKVSMLVVLGGVLVVPVQAQNRLTCSEVVKPSSEGSLRVAMSDVVEEHICANIEPPVDFDNIFDRCEAFCGPSGIPIPIGTDTVGFNFEEIDAVCTGEVTEGGSDPVLRYDPDLKANCEDWGEAVQDINRRAADFIASVTNMTFEQLIYRTAMADKVAEMQLVITSDEVQEQLELERVDRKMERLQTIIEDNLADLMTSGLLSRGLESRLDNLELKANLLMETIERELPKVTNFTEQCNDVILAAGPGDVYMLDICSVTSTECIDEADGWGRHVGCCCGMIPAVGSATTTDGGRRLQVAEEVDVCGKAAEVGSRDLEVSVTRLTQIIGGSEMLEAYDTQQRDAYPDYYNDCDAPTAGARRLDSQTAKAILDKASSRSQKHKDVQASQKVSKHPEDKGSGKHEWMTEQQSRNLQGYLTCTPPTQSTDPNITTPLTVPFWEHTQQALCKDIQEPDPVGEMTNDRLASLCASFCAPDSIPLVLGTTSFGFTQAQMDSVCLQPDRAGASYDATRIDQCHEDASIFTRLQDTTAAFATSLQVLEVSKLRFQAYANNAKENLKDVIEADAQTTLDNAAPSLKLSALQDLIRTALGDILGGSVAKRDLQADAAAVATAATALREELNVAIPGLRNFLDNCNFLTTGVGPSNEYLLDLCSQTSQECIDAEEGTHAGCCCGYNPIITLGTPGVAAGTPTITGMDADIFASSAPPPPPPTPPPPPPADGSAVALPTRAAPVLSPIVDICAKAHSDSKAQIEVYRLDISLSTEEGGQNQPELYLEAEQSKRERYADYYDRCTAPAERWTWSDAVRSTGSGAGSWVSSWFSSSPAIRVRPVDAPLLAGLLLSVVVLVGYS